MRLSSSDPDTPSVGKKGRRVTGLGDAVRNMIPLGSHIASVATYDAVLLGQVFGTQMRVERAPIGQ